MSDHFLEALSEPPSGMILPSLLRERAVEQKEPLFSGVREQKLSRNFSSLHGCDSCLAWPPRFSESVVIFGIRNHGTVICIDEHRHQRAEIINLYSLHEPIRGKHNEQYYRWTLWLIHFRKTWAACTTKAIFSHFLAKMEWSTALLTASIRFLTNIDE